MATFVLVHGAMHGGWCWSRVLPFLRAGGHRVFTPTLTGMGERAHLVSRDVGLDTHVQDIRAVLTNEDLTDVILVGHSYAGMVITAVAEELVERLRHLIYLDAFTPHDGEAALDLEPLGTDAAFRARARDGWLLMPAESDLERWGLREEQDRRWVWPKLTPMPLRCFEDKVALPSGAAASLPRTYLECTTPANPGLRSSADRAKGENWLWQTLATGHEAMVTAPAELAQALSREC